MTDHQSQQLLALHTEQLATLKHIGQLNPAGLSEQLHRLSEHLSALAAQSRQHTAQVCGYLQLLIERARVPWWRRLLGR